MGVRQKFQGYAGGTQMKKVENPCFRLYLQYNFKTFVSLKFSDFQFLFFYFVVCVNSLISDTVCYVRILNYMRQNAVRVTVVATSHAERQKGRNIVSRPGVNFNKWFAPYAHHLHPTLNFHASKKLTKSWAQGANDRRRSQNGLRNRPQTNVFFVSQAWFN